MSIVNFNVNEFPKLQEEFHKQNQSDWIVFLESLGYKFKWNHYASKKKYVEMDEVNYILFVLRWS